MNESRKNTLIKTIEIRLEGVRESSKRARLAFLVATIASSAITVTIWSAYFSWSRNFAFPDVPLEVAKKYEGQEVPCEEFKRILDEESQKLPASTQGNERFPLPLREFNKRNAATEWVKTLSVSIDPLGIEVNVNDFAIIGSLSLIIISFWLLFSVRRENRAIVTLLRDIYHETRFSSANKGDDKWDIANLAFQGAAHSLVFISVGNDDRPMSNDEIFAEGKKYNLIDEIVGRFTSIVRYLVILLMLLPALTIFFIVYADYQSLSQCSPLRPNFLMLQDAVTGNLKYIFDRDVFFSIVVGTFTMIICLTSIVYQERTTKALNAFARRLGLKDVTPSHKIATLELTVSKNGEVVIEWESDEFDALELQYRKSGTEMWQSADKSTEKVIEFAPPLTTLGAPEKFEFRAVFLQKNTRVGQWSAIYSITVG